MAPLQKNETWKPGKCLKKLSDRSFLVKTSGNSQVIRRNREFLNPAEKQAVLHKSVPSNQASLEENQPVVCGTQPSSPNNKKKTIKFPPPATKGTRARVIKTPAKFRDYVVFKQENYSNSIDFFWYELCRDINYSDGGSIDNYLTVSLID